MTTINPYIPILRWRPAEIKALEKLFNQDREKLTPLIEFVMPAPTKDPHDRNVIKKTSKQKFLETLPNVASNLLKSCGQNTIFIDVHLLDSDVRASSFEQILSSSNKLNLFSVPVIYIIPVTSTSADMTTRAIAINYAKSSGHGLCIRIDRSHFDEKNLSSHISKFITDNKLDIKNADLLIDFGVIKQNENTADIAKKLNGIPNLEKWRSLIVSGGVFPKDLTEYTSGKAHELQRWDWKLWNSLQKTKLSRMPFFSDYTIQCPEYERVDLIGSVSVRYTDSDKWWIFRGTKPGIDKKTNEKKPGLEQYIGHAKTITGPSFRKFYEGVDFSFGDAEIARIAAQGNKKPGNAGTWLTISINHHITLAARQFANSAEKKAERS
jgi:hypothetical protein